MTDFRHSVPKLWIGFVEDRNDPLMASRVRVRVVGYHSDSRIEMPTELLPWAIVSFPPGTTDFSPPKEGTQVIGMFYDGDHAQAPIVLGAFQVTVPTNKITDPNRGFSDPRTSTPSSDYPGNPESIEYSITGNTIGATITEPSDRGTYPLSVNQTTLPPEAQGSSAQSQQNKTNSLIENVKTGDGDGNGGTVWDEPKSSYQPKYPYNRVIASESGHVIELDDTPSAERVHVYHRSGAFVEISPDGSIVFKSVNDNYHIAMGNRYTAIFSDDNLTIAGSSSVRIEGDCVIDVLGDSSIFVSGNVQQKVNGDYNLDVSGDITIQGSTINLNP
jgi:hypothetical protein